MMKTCVSSNSLHSVRVDSLIINDSMTDRPTDSNFNTVGDVGKTSTAGGNGPLFSDISWQKRIELVCDAENGMERPTISGLFAGESWL